MSSRLIGDGMTVISTDQSAGRLYLCPCGVRVWSTWGNARTHSHGCPQAWASGSVPDDHSDTSRFRGRAACPVCARDVAFSSDHDGARVRSIARHKNPDGKWCEAQNWEIEECVSGRFENGDFFYRRLG